MKRISRLYIKIFFAFLGMLILVEVLTFGLFHHTVGRYFSEKTDRAAQSQANMFTTLIEDRLNRGGFASPVDDQLLVDLLTDLARSVDAQVWMTDPTGAVVWQSFTGPVPSLKRVKRRIKNIDGTNVLVSKGISYYFSTLIDPADRQPTRVHILVRPHWKDHPADRFVPGLVVIGFIVALLVLPLSRAISKPIKELRRSALMIADGDLNHRAVIDRCDEIGELGQAFNFMAERLERMVRNGKEMLANLSHELRSPLARIRMSEELLRRPAKPGAEAKNRERIEQLLAGVEEEIDHMDGLIDRIMLLSKLDLAESPLKQEDCRLEVIIKELLERFGPAAEARGIKLDPPPEEDHRLTADCAALKTVLVNLLDNAVKYTPAGGRVNIRIDRRGKSLVTVMTNTHPPLSEEELAAIMKPFIRGRQVTQVGSGLGLSLCTRIVRRHGGTLTAHNSPDGFTVELGLPMD